MFIIIVTLIFVILAWKWGDWRNWKLYYSTIIFMILGDFIYLFLTFQKPLWTMESTILGRTFTNLLIAFFIYPSFVLLYLSNFPKENLEKKVFYISAFTLFFTAFEYIFIKFDSISYYNSWNLWWTFLFDIMLFILLRVHYKKPLLGIFFAVVVGTCIMLIFKIPLPR